jgi:hypothetical protein
VPNSNENSVTASLRFFGIVARLLVVLIDDDDDDDDDDDSRDWRLV